MGVHGHDALGEEKPDVHGQVEIMLKAYDSRYTNGRRQLVDALNQAKGPVTLPELMSDNPELPQSSIYRNLDVLERCGVIHRLVTGSEFTYFELAEALLGHHHHLICSSCGSVTDIELDVETEQMLNDALERAAATVSFRPRHHCLDLHGLCESCT